MAKANLKAVPEEPIDKKNPLIGDNASDTINRAHHVASYLMLTATNLAHHGSNDAATDGLSLISEALVNALEVAGEQIDSELRRAKGGAA